MSELYSCHKNPPTPGWPVSISAATITSHAMPRLKRKPVNIYGSVAGISTLNSVFVRDSFSTFATFVIVNSFARSIPEGLRYRHRFRNDDGGLFAATADVRSNPQELESVQARRERALNGILRRLNEREREIIVCRFGLRRGHEPKTLKEVGSVLGVSKERVRQIEIRALGKLREAAVQRTLAKR